MSRLSHRLPRRPWTLWSLSLIVTAMGVANLLLALDHARHAADYRALGVSYPPLLRAGCALGWGVALLALAGGLWRRRRWARHWSLIVLSNYGAFGVLWLLVFARSDYSRGRIAFQTVLTVILLALLGWMMRGRRVKAALGLPAARTADSEVTLIDHPEPEPGDISA